MSRILRFGTDGFDGAVPLDRSTITPDALAQGELLRRRFAGAQVPQGEVPAASGGKAGPTAEFAPSSLQPAKASPAWGETITLPGTGERMLARRQGGAVVETAPMDASADLIRRWVQKQAHEDAAQQLGLFDTFGLSPDRAAQLGLQRNQQVAELAAANLGREQQGQQFQRQLDAGAADRAGQMDRLQLELGSRRSLADSENANRLKLAEINDPGRTAWAQAGAAAAMDPTVSIDSFRQRRAMLSGTPSVVPATGAPDVQAAPGTTQPPTYDARGDEILTAIRTSLGKAQPSPDGKSSKYAIDPKLVTPDAVAKLATTLAPQMKGMTPEQMSAVAQQLRQSGMDLAPVRDRVAQEAARRQIVAAGGSPAGSLTSPADWTVKDQLGSPLYSLSQQDQTLGGAAGRVMGSVGGNTRRAMYDTITLPDGTRVPFDRGTLPGAASSVFGTGWEGQRQRDAAANPAITSLLKVLTANARPPQ